jgi:heme-degrading monooxygenase HmoA
LKVNKPLDSSYYAVIFTSMKNKTAPGYDEMAVQMERLSSCQEGFLGIQSVRGDDGVGITVSYWRSLKDIANWKNQSEHKLAQQKGRADWYAGYEVRVCKVEREYNFGQSDKL